MNVSALVIGYGNELRRDDGLGPRVAAEIAGQSWPGVQVLQLPQLLPELAEALAECRLAVFVDSRCAAPDEPIRVQPLVPTVVPAPTHHSDPAALLALAHALYGRVAPAWWVTVAGHDFGGGEGLSAVVEALVPEVVRRIAALLT